MQEVARKQQQQQPLYLGLPKKNVSALNLSSTFFKPDPTSLQYLNSKSSKTRSREVAAPYIQMSKTVNHLSTSGFINRYENDQFREKKQKGKLEDSNTARFNSTGHNENLLPPAFLDDEALAITTQTMNNQEYKLSCANSTDTRGSSVELESRKALLRQIQHLQKMNEYFQITLKQKDSVYKAVVVENIKLKHQIQLLEQQIHAKQISQEQNLLFKTQKSLLAENFHSLKLQTQSTQAQFTSPKRTETTVGLATNGNQSIKNLQVMSNPSQIMAGFKPTRLSTLPTSEQTEQIVNQVRKSQGRKATITVLKGAIQRKKVVVIDEELQKKQDESQIHTDEDNTDQSNSENATLFRVSTFFQANDSEGRPILPAGIKNEDDSENINQNIIYNPTDQTKQEKLLSNNQSNNYLSVGNHSSATRSAGFLSETSMKNTFDQLPDDEPSTPQSELKSEFVTHSTDFAFVTQLLDLKSKSADNLKLYTDNKWITHMRSILSDERTLKRTILHLSKGSFSQFYESLIRTLESSDLFFHLTNKLKSIVSAIIKINIQVESSNAFSMIVKEICQALNCDRASVFLVNGTTQELWTKVAKGVGVIKVPFGQGLVGYVANSLKPLNILDAHKDSRFNPEIDKKNNYHTQSVLCMPVIDSEKGNLLGVVQAINKIDGFFTKDDEGCLQIMAVHAMNVLRNSISNDENQKSQNIVKNLLEMSIKLSKYNTIEQMLPKATSLISQYIDVPEVKLFLLDESTSKIFFYSSEGQRIEFNKDCGLIGYTIQSAIDQNIDSAYNHTSFNKLVDIDTSMPVSIYIIWDNPTKKREILGALEIVNFNGINNISLAKSSKTSFKFDKQIKTFCEIVGAKIKQLRSFPNINNLK